jgi:hypothetical protein
MERGAVATGSWGRAAFRFTIHAGRSGVAVEDLGELLGFDTWHLYSATDQREDDAWMHECGGRTSAESEFVFRTLVDQLSAHAAQLSELRTAGAELMLAVSGSAEDSGFSPTAAELARIDRLGIRLILGEVRA